MWAERYDLARFVAAVAVVAIVVGWALAEDPYLLPRAADARPGGRRRRDAGRGLIVIGVGLLILGPSLWFLYRLVLQGRLDQSYEPLDQRFRP